ncbi:MAG: hypothetical protein F6K36_01160 [Symploca sp. SIO3C6]|uniref:Uncharacterized protein n=1 Tax=Symploca sp. SIO1C4 TaxID=2607765 RepID=A0A6B3NGN4_9CYAN|nr:hypothetical protein [Symploca sp. SIO3C6]NER30820.1 hypothetical protein [Symploca sp. SIO1C4]
MSTSSLWLTVAAQEHNRDHRSKIFQCNQISLIVNKAVKDVNNVSSNSNASDNENLLIAANKIDYYAQKLETIAIADPILQIYQSRFAKMYTDTSAATSNLVTAFNNQNRVQAELAMQALQAATSVEEQLVEDINNYCQAMPNDK